MLDNFFNPGRKFVYSLLVIGTILAAACNRDTKTPTEEVTIQTSLQVTTEVADGMRDYIVVFDRSTENVEDLAVSLVDNNNGTMKHVYTTALKGFAARLPEQAIQGIENNPNVDYIEQDGMITVFPVEGADTQRTPPWGLDRIDQRTLPLNSLYQYSFTGTGVTVYIIDTGIRTTHTEFGGRAVSGFSAVPDSIGTNDCHGHGTHVAGTVGGSTYGVAKNVSLVAVRVLGCTGSGQWSWVIAGLDWMTRTATLPAVANMSIGGAFTQAANDAVEAAVRAGIVNVVAAGNSAADACLYSPASAPSALTAGATDATDFRASFSNFGTCLDIFAPGVSVLSAYNTDDNATRFLSGTSMASPHVAGVAALMLEAVPTATPAEVDRAMSILSTKDVVLSPGLGSPNELLYSPGDTTAVPPPPPPSDMPPVASFTVRCPKGVCLFDASGSTDDNGIISYTWNFGDGTADTVVTVPFMEYTYLQDGFYRIKLVVADTANQTSTIFRNKRINVQRNTIK